MNSMIQTGSDMDNRIAQEIALIKSALENKGMTSDRYAQFYAAQQALAWVLDQELFASPYLTITNGDLPMGTQAGSEDYSALSRLPQSSDTCSSPG